jgi:hypothetical protein
MPSGPWQGEHKRAGSGPASRPHSAAPASMSKRPAPAASSRSVTSVTLPFESLAALLQDVLPDLQEGVFSFFARCICRNDPNRLTWSDVTSATADHSALHHACRSRVLRVRSLARTPLQQVRGQHPVCLRCLRARTVLSRSSDHSTRMRITNKCMVRPNLVTSPALECLYSARWCL